MLFALWLKVLSVELLHQGITLVLFIAQDASHRALMPHLLAARRRNTVFHQPGSNGVWRQPFEEPIVDIPDGFRLLLIHQNLTLEAALEAQGVLEGNGHLAVGHALPLAPGDVFGNALAFLLSQAAHDGDQQFAFAIKCPDVFLFKVALDAFFLQLPDGGQAVDSVPGKAADGLGDDEIYFVRLFDTM